MSEHNRCTYRVTETVKPDMERKKLVMYCRHIAKKLPSNQMAQSKLARARKAKHHCFHRYKTRKRTACPSHFTLVTQIPLKSKKQQSLSPICWLTVGRWNWTSTTTIPYMQHIHCHYETCHVTLKIAVWPVWSGTQCCISNACSLAAATSRIYLTCWSANCAHWLSS